MSQQSTGSQTSPGPADSVPWPRGHIGIPRGYSHPSVAVAWGFGRCTRAVWMVVCLCPSAWQEWKQPLLRAWFGRHCCQEKEAPSCQHNYLCFLHPPFLMWQLSAYHSAWCQGNHCGVGWAESTALPQPKRRVLGCLVF